MTQTNKKPQPQPHPLSKINSKWITNLKTKCQNIKPLEIKLRQKSSRSKARQNALRCDLKKKKSHKRKI